ncbi:unnamed protein product [Vitrella brassicaformis CCMP3155]|uniref:TLDc domain-containing protein n=1 Tax=Vitrella brassicaformis (strain CCMP3155) TaxID=1169540 RepID=A0A0G4EU64_VITBC|nr:unnamed protein product [Vitrella brassicaformis CCMP3155]|eukprot:CEM01625.1 unnamed protein product [Vitrella brassicaformis CCMP3155]
MFAKKRKVEEPPESPADDSDEFEPLPFIGRASVDALFKEADEALAAIEQSAKQMRKKLRQQAKTIKDLITTNAAQPSVTGPLSEEIEVNVGGTVLCVPRKPLLLPGVSESIIAYLLLYHLDGLPKDKDGRPFLDADPVYLEWLFNEITDVGVADAQGESHEIVLTPPHDTDSSSVSWHHLLFATKTGLDVDRPTDPPPHNDDDDHMEVDNQQQQQQQAGEAASEEKGEPAGEQEGASDHMAALKSSTASLDASLGRLGETVSTTEATLASIGTDKRLYRTFHSGAPVSSIRPDHFMKVTDFARRRRIAPPGTLVRPPTSTRTKQIRTDTEMYGLKYEPFFSGLAGGNLVIETAEEWGEVLKMTGKTSPMASLLYKGSRDTYAFPKMLECVEGKSGLLFAIKHGRTHRFGCFIDGPLTPPADPTQTNIYKVPVFFFSLSGAYETPTKIEIPEERQRVTVAGTQGAVTYRNGEPLANICIARGYLWLGLAVPGPAAYLSRCYQGMEKECLSEGYRGRRGSYGTLAQFMNFTCTEMEIWQIATG